MNEFIVAGARLNSKDNSVYNLNCHVYTKIELMEWIDDMYTGEDGNGFPSSGVLFNELLIKGVYRFTTDNFMFVIKTKNKALKK